jgi:aminoglycoside phosphotransferase (APT) family kinase protein
LPTDIRLERRDDRWAATLPGDRMAWLPASENGVQRLARERRILRLIEQHCSFRAPRIELEHPSGFDVRAIVPGRCEPWPLFERVKHDAPLARRIGSALGAILAEQHSRITASDVTGWLPQRLSWPEPSGWIMQRLPKFTDDATLIASVERLLSAYDTIAVDTADRVLVHADLGLHNVVMQGDDVAGVFDYDGAGFADRHHDFRYLTFLCEREHMLEAALAIYEAATGRKLDRRRIELYNAVCGVSFLASRGDAAPDERPAGRTPAEDLGWVRGAIARLDAMPG